MSSTFSTRLVGPEGRRLALYFTIDGIPDVFQEDDVDVPSAFVTTTGRTRRKLIAKIEQSMAKLDLQQRRMVGGSLTVRLHDDDTGTLAALFASRSRRTSYITATETVSDATLNVADTTDLPSAGTVYVDAETITYTAKTGTTLTGCTRGAFGSTAQRHYGGTDQGAGVYEVPPSWTGRRLRLYGYFVNDDDTTTTDLRTQLDTFRLEEAPAYLGDGIWELRCSHLSDEVAARKLGSGLKKVPAYPIRAVAGTDDLDWVAHKTPLFVAGTYPTFVAIEFADGPPAVLRLLESAGTATTIITTAYEGGLANGGGTSVQLVPGVSATTVDVGERSRLPDSFQHWAILQHGVPGVLALFALCSVVGDGTNGTYDVLPGSERTAFGLEGFRMGAGIPNAEVDDAAFLDVGWGNPFFSFVLHEQVDVADFLADFCVGAEAFWLVTREGLLTVQRLSEKEVTPTFTVDDDVVAAGTTPTLAVDEESIAARARLRLDWDPFAGEFRSSIGVVDTEMAARYPDRGDALELELRSLCLEPGPLMRPHVESMGALETMLRRAMVDDGRGRLFVDVTLTLDALELDLGDVVDLDLDLPDYAGGTLAASAGRTARVIGRAPDYDKGTVDVRLQVLEKLQFIAPACVIASAVGATLTLATTGFEIPDANPANMFQAQTFVQVVDVSTGTIEELYIDSVTAPATIVLGAAPSFAISGGNDFVRLSTIDSNFGAAGTSANGYSVDDFAYQQPSSTLATRWR